MKTDTPGFLDVKLAIITKDPAPWLDALAAIGTVEHEEDVTGWAHRRVATSAKLGDLVIRVRGLVGGPRAAGRSALSAAVAGIGAAAPGIPAVSMGGCRASSARPRKRPCSARSKTYCARQRRARESDRRLRAGV